MIIIKIKYNDVPSSVIVVQLEKNKIVDYGYHGSSKYTLRSKGLGVMWIQRNGDSITEMDLHDPIFWSEMLRIIALPEVTWEWEIDNPEGKVVKFDWGKYTDWGK